MAYRRARNKLAFTAVATGLALVTLAGCASVPVIGRNAREARIGNDRLERRDPGATIGVNAFLWRASLDTLSFMPLASADPYGGVIITDWYSDPTKTDERFKATVYILDTRLRADGLNVNINRQVRSGAEWVEAPAAADTEDQIENAILLRARQIRVTGR